MKHLTWTDGENEIIVSWNDEYPDEITFEVPRHAVKQPVYSQRNPRVTLPRELLNKITRQPK